MSRMDVHARSKVKRITRGRANSAKAAKLAASAIASAGYWHRQVRDAGEPSGHQQTADTGCRHL